MKATMKLCNKKNRKHGVSCGLEIGHDSSHLFQRVGFSVSWPNRIKVDGPKISPLDRDQVRIRFCPSCGRKPEIPFTNSGRHIYTGYCEKCQARFMVHVA